MKEEAAQQSISNTGDELDHECEEKVLRDVILEAVRIADAKAGGEIWVSEKRLRLENKIGAQILENDHDLKEAFAQAVKLFIRESIKEMK